MYVKIILSTPPLTKWFRTFRFHPSSSCALAQPQLRVAGGMDSTQSHSNDIVCSVSSCTLLGLSPWPQSDTTTVWFHHQGNIRHMKWGGRSQSKHKLFRITELTHALASPSQILSFLWPLHVQLPILVPGCGSWGGATRDTDAKDRWSKQTLVRGSFASCATAAETWKVKRGMLHGSDYEQPQRAGHLGVHPSTGDLTIHRAFSQVSTTETHPKKTLLQSSAPTCGRV